MPHPEIATRAAQLEAQSREVETLLEALRDGDVAWRPEPGRWSVGEHLAHLVVVNRPYVAAIRGALEEARRRGLQGPGPYRHPWIGGFFVRSMEPPVRLRVRTMSAMEPGPPRPPDVLRAEFGAAQGEVLAALREAEGVDLGRARLSSPFFRLLRLSVGQAFDVILAHNRRHLWHVRALLDHPDFPGGTP